MNCPECGQENLDRARFCVNCGYQLRAAGTAELPPEPRATTAAGPGDEDIHTTQPDGDRADDLAPPPPDFGPITPPSTGATNPLPHTADTREFTASDFMLMVVDDTPDSLVLVSLHLQQSGFRVITASNGEEAVRLAEAAGPDLILMDIGMPGLDGLGATRRMRENPALERVPVVALTAFSTEGFRRAAYDAGIDGYLTKPVDFDRLHELVRRLLPVQK
jgi:two-component system, cell cycle response regulator DivK